jgi:cytochrome c oxidase subunit II
MFRWWMPTNASAHGLALDRHMAWTLGVVAALYVVSQAFLLIGLLRRSKDARRFSVWAVGAFVTVAALFIGLGLRAESLWAAQHFEGPSYDALQVEVTGRQFQWYFRYPGADAQFGRIRPELADAAAGNPLGIDRADLAAADDIVSSELVLPVGREVNLRVRSQDVVHGFFIPAMRVKQNAVPGSIFTIHFTPTAIGEYGIVCSQVCGSGHYRMDARLRVVSPSDFSAWGKSLAPDAAR